MMQHLRAVAIIASILCIVSVMYFVAVRGGSIDLPLPWGQSATVQIPEPQREVSQSTADEDGPTEVQDPARRTCEPGTYRREGNSIFPCGEVVEGQIMRMAPVGIWQGSLRIQGTNYSTFLELEFYSSGQYEVTLPDARLPFRPHERGTWTEREDGTVEWRIQSTTFYGRVVGNLLEGECYNPSCTFRFDRVRQRFTE